MGPPIVKHSGRLTAFLARVGALYQRHGEQQRRGTRTGQGRSRGAGARQRKPRCGAFPVHRATAGSGSRSSGIRAEAATGAELSCHNLVFGGAIEVPNHDAAMRIGGNAPGQRDHSVERRKPGNSLVHRHLGS